MDVEHLMRRRLAVQPGLAVGMLDLLEAPGGWIRRRVERVDYVGFEEIAVASTLDIHLPRPAQDAVSVDGRRTLLLPLGYGVKGHKLTRFDLSAEDEPASLMTLPENAALSAAVLAVLARECGIRADVRAALETLCGPGPGPARAAALQAEVLEGRGAGTERLRRWMAFLSTRYVLYAALRREAADPLLQRHVRTAQTLSLGPAADADDGAVREPPVRAALGELRATLPVFDLGFASSYHLDLGVPAELRIVRATLRDAAGTALDADEDCDRATLETRGRRPYDGQAEVELVIRPEQRAFSREAWPVSIFLALATVIAVIPVAFDEPTPSGLVALLLAPVAAAIALGFRSYSEDLTRLLVGRQQRFLQVQVSCLAGAIAVLLCRPLAPGRDWFLDRLGGWVATPLSVAVALLVAAPLAGALLGAVIQHRAHRKAPKETIS